MQQRLQPKIKNINRLGNAIIPGVGKGLILS
jgi:hypothetical protein